MIDIACSRTPAMEQMAARLGVQLVYLGEEVEFFSPKAKRKRLTLIDGLDPALRMHIEKGNANAVIGLETEAKQDSLHARRAGLNQVLAEILAKKDCMVLFDHSLIRRLSGPNRAIIIGRMQQNVELCRKYKVRMGVVTMAKSPYDLRSPADLRSFAVQLGMLPGEAKMAIGIRLPNTR